MSKPPFFALMPRRLLTLQSGQPVRVDRPGGVGTCSPWCYVAGPACPRPPPAVATSRAGGLTLSVPVASALGPSTSELGRCISCPVPLHVLLRHGPRAL